MMSNADQGTSASVPPRLWSVPAFVSYLQPPLTDQVLKEAEEQLGVWLPQAYVAALRVQNGGYLRLTNHPTGLAPVGLINGIGPRFPSILRHDWTDEKEYMAEEGIGTPEQIDDLLPFCGDGHFYYCFDYRRSGREREPCVTYIDVESFDADEVVAPDFGTFLQQLRPGQVEEAHGLTTCDPAEVVATVVSGAIGFFLQDRGDEDNGYRLFSAPLPGDMGWVWLAANRTRKGFVRKSDDEYEKLSRLLPEMVDRFPEHADCGYFLSCSGADFQSEVGRAIVASLAKLPFPSRPVLLEGP